MKVEGKFMSMLKLSHINKIYDNHVQAVFDFNLEINDHEFIVFVGPSGCGKSTTLRMIAGLEEISSGELYIGDVLANDVPSKDRDIAMVFQNYALYPHMTVYENMAFGLRNRHVPKDEIDRRIKEAAEILDITDYLKRKPKALSGGQCQRVALGRAIVRKAQVFLMDEPLSNLDAKLRVSMRSEIIKLHEKTGATTIYVTHDQTEAMTMANRIVVMKKGYIQQIGTPKEIYDRPYNLFVAGFIGSPAMNFLKVKVTQDGITSVDGSFTIKDPYFYSIVMQKYISTFNEAKKHYDEHYQELVPYLECLSKIEAMESLETKDEKSLLELTKEKEAFEKKSPYLASVVHYYTEYSKILKDTTYPAILGIRPENIVLSSRRGSIITGYADVIEMMGDVLLIHSTVQGKEFIAKTSSEQHVEPHGPVFYKFDKEKIHLFDVVDEVAII